MVLLEVVACNDAGRCLAAVVVLAVADLVTKNALQATHQEVVSASRKCHVLYFCDQRARLCRVTDI